MEPKAQKYNIVVDDLGDFDLDDDRSISPSIEFALKQAGIKDAQMDQNEFNRGAVEVTTTATQHEIEQALKQDDLHAEVSMMEDEQYFPTGPGHFKQDDYTTSVKKEKKFKYVPARHGDNGLADESKQTEEMKEEIEARFTKLKEEYDQFVADSDSEKKKTEKSGLAESKIVQALDRDHRAVISAGESASGISKITDTPIFQSAVESLFRIGRSRVEYGKIVPIGDVDDLISKVKSTGIKAPNFTPGFIKQAMAVTDVDELNKSLSTLPSGEPFADLVKGQDQDGKPQGLINNAQDVATFLATKKIVLEILAKLSTQRRAGGFGQALKKAVGDISQAAGVDV